MPIPGRLIHRLVISSLSPDVDSDITAGNSFSESGAILVPKTREEGRQFNVFRSLSEGPVRGGVGGSQ